MLIVEECCAAAYLGVYDPKLQIKTRISSENYVLQKSFDVPLKKVSVNRHFKMARANITPESAEKR